MTLKLAIRYLKGRMLRTILTTLSIVFGVMIIFGMNGLIPALNEAFDKSMNESVHQVDILLTHELGITFDDSKLDILRRQSDIEIVSPILERTLTMGEAYKLKSKDGNFIEKIVVNGWDPGTSEQALPLNLDAGRWITESDTRAIIVRASFLSDTGKSLGDQITIPTAYGKDTFVIVGVLPKAPAIGKHEIYMTLNQAQKVFNMEGQVSAAIAQFDESVTNEEARRQELKDAFGDGYAFGSIDAGGNEWSAIIKMGNVIFTVFGAVALAMGGFIIYNTFKVSIAERSKDIGMLRTLGARKSDIFKLVITEGLIQGLLGTGLGMVAGYVLLSLSIPAIQPIWKELFNVDLGAPQFPVSLYILSCMLGVGVPVLSVFIPARRAASVEPLDAIRPNMQGRKVNHFGRAKRLGLLLLVLSGGGLALGAAYVKFIGAVLLMIALILLNPYLTDMLLHSLSGFIKDKLVIMARNNTLREPKRSANTATTMLVSIAFIVAVTGMASTFTNGLLGYMKKSMSSDYLILQDAMILGSEGGVGADESLSRKIRNIDGVLEITEFRQSDAKAGTIPLSMIGIDVDSYKSLSGLTFLDGNEEKAYEWVKEGKNLIINGALAVQGGYQVGDPIVLTTVNGDITYKVAGIGLDYLNSKSATAYMSHRNIEEDYNTFGNALIMVNRTPDADPKAVEKQLIDVMEEYPAFSVLSYEVWLEFQEEGNRTRNMFMYILTAILAVPALIGLMNTLSMNIIERTREIGMLRAVGMTAAQLKKMILAESLFISGIGVLLGSVAGIGLGYGFVQLMNVSGFILEYSFPLAGLIVSIVIGILFAVLASLSPIKRATQFDIVDAIKYE